MSAQNFATACPAHLISLVQSIAQPGKAPTLGKKVLNVYSKEDMEKKFNLVTLPAAAVLYEGTRSTDSDQKGVSASIVCSILLLAEDTKAVPGVESRDGALALLDDVRRAVMGQKSPTGHFWTFVLEAPAGELKGQVVWLQRWKTAVQMVSRPS